MLPACYYYPVWYGQALTLLIHSGSKHYKFAIALCDSADEIDGNAQNPGLNSSVYRPKMPSAAKALIRVIGYAE